MTAYDRMMAETDSTVLLRLLWYVNAIRACQGLSPLQSLRRPAYILSAAHHIHCPFWLSCFDKPAITQLDISALELYLHMFGFIMVQPAWVGDWTRRHADLWLADVRAMGR